ncbi:CLA4A regulator, partial [Atractosteus spatula]|nr:CLA4A regulator [Atractosteus spatula]
MDGGAVLFLLLSSLSGGACKIELDGNGFTNILVAINPAVPENPQLIQNIKDMITNSSAYLFTATRKMFYFKDVKLLVPPNWAPHPNYTRGKTESYENANVVIKDMSHGDDPYTLQYDECGKPGKYIHLTPSFLLNDSLLNAYGPRGRVFVHEWAHLRWGVYDEYNEDTPFYISSSQQVEATRCSKHLTGSLGVPSSSDSSLQRCSKDQITGLPSANCQFFPDKTQNTPVSIMYLQSLPAITEFCDDKSHNREAPNMQNRMCNYRSVWSVIGSAPDFDRTTPMTVDPPPPQFTLLQKGRRVVCLVLDVSGSMGGFDRLTRLRQAATLFLREIIEDQSMVGIVTFTSSGTIVKSLTLVHDETSREELVKALPTTAGGGTAICRGLDSGFQVLREDDRSTFGDEIVLLSDGESPVDCLVQVGNSGAIVHGIALGPSADKRVEIMVNMTGGKYILATDKVDSNGLVDAFAALTTSDGNLTLQSIQLESTGMNTGGNSWFNGTVSVDKTVGNDTSFLIIWGTSVPDIIVTSPTGFIYTNTDFSQNKDLKTATLKIPGTAEVGDWTYSLHNTQSSQQALAVTVTSHAASASVDPVTVKAHMNQEVSNGSRPMLVFAEVRQGDLPVILTDVVATIESNDGSKEELQLLDNGAGADVFRHDGIYTKYFTNVRKSGTFNLKVRVQGREDTARLSVRRHGRALYIPGYMEDVVNIAASQHWGPGFNSRSAVCVEFVCSPHIHMGFLQFPPTAQRHTGQLQLNPQRPPGSEEDLQARFPPCTITDLSARIEAQEVLLTWTAPGEDYDQGRAKSYEIRMSPDFELLRKNFSDAQLVNVSLSLPKEAGSMEEYSFSPESILLQNGTILYFAARSEDHENLTSEVSNIAQSALIVPGPDPPTGPEPGPPSSVNITVLVLSVTGVVAAACIVASTVMCVKKRKRTTSA